MPLAGRQFRPTLVPTLVTLVLLPVMISLGFWQLDRADQKQAILDEYRQREQLPPLDLAAPVAEPERIRYRRARLVGEFDASRIVFVDNKVVHGVVGFDVLVPLRVQDTARWVVVNRGWVPGGTRRDILPQADIPAGEVVVTGRVSVPSDNPFVDAELNWSEGWPAVVQWPDLEGFARRAGLALQPVVVLEDPVEGAGFVREWALVYAPPEKSLSYAVQWFALSTALLIIYVVVNLKKPSAPERDSE
ncbi:MAG: hypothetical protein AMJ69_01475 [Gammaproteobacteria bacterium SG8_47]|nr:MAG: hypothetical protein AMJ69_01475 [Gammaproteobacteria bacterium SG8_47]